MKALEKKSPEKERIRKTSREKHLSRKALIIFGEKFSRAIGKSYLEKYVPISRAKQSMRDIEKYIYNVVWCNGMYIKLMLWTHYASPIVSLCQNQTDT